MNSVNFAKKFDIRKCFAGVNYLRTMNTLDHLVFDNTLLRKLPIDKEKANFVRPVPDACFSLVKPTPVENPELVAFSKSALQLIDLDEEDALTAKFLEVFSGNEILKGSNPAAHCYCGHQFGHFSGQLGDGAAIYLGEILNKKNERWEIQLKGAGKTPYSRTADGRKVLRSTIREFLCSEAIHHLGIPTTRAGSCITSDSMVVRDIFYSGNPINEKCSIVLRIAPTFIRFGSFEIFKSADATTGRAGPSVGREDIKETLLNYVVETFYPELWSEYSENKSRAYFEFYKELVRRTARLVAEWQSVGWCHGVLNTDNMSIVGLTIDYGPFGFIDNYQPEFICNGSDDGGRYSYKNQPEVCQWNCLKLAEMLDPLVPVDESKAFLEEEYMKEFDHYYISKMRKKLGLFNEDAEDRSLVDAFFEAMESCGSDFTNSFRCLSSLPLPSSPDFEEKKEQVLNHLLQQCSTIDDLKELYKPQMEPRQFQMILMMIQMQPNFANMLSRGSEQIELEVERYKKQEKLKEITQDEHSSQCQETWQVWLERYTQRLSMEVEPDADLNMVNKRRKQVMNSNNPRVILRNYIAQQAIESAEKGDYSEVRRVLTMLEDPYGEPDVNMGKSAVDCSTKPAGTEAGNLHSSYDSKPPTWAYSLRVT